MCAVMIVIVRQIVDLDRGAGKFIGQNGVQFVGG